MEFNLSYNSNVHEDTLFEVYCPEIGSTFRDIVTAVYLKDNICKINLADIEMIYSPFPSRKEVNFIRYDGLKERLDKIPLFNFILTTYTKEGEIKDVFNLSTETVKINDFQSDITYSIEFNIK